MKRLVTVLFIGLVTPLTAGAMSMQQAPGSVVVSSAPNTFATRIVVVPRGARARFAQLDLLGVHNVVALDGGTAGNPLFQTSTLRFGQSGEIVGVSRLPAGDYPFSCSVHEQMYGLLLVR